MNPPRSNKTYGWILQKFVLIFGVNSEIVRILQDLHDEYAPLKIIKDIEAKQISQELGSSLVISVEAQGVPRPIYEWLYLTQEAEKREWKTIDLHPSTKSIFIDNFSIDDVGLYRCKIRHGLPVVH